MKMICLKCLKEYNGDLNRNNGCPKCVKSSIPEVEREPASDAVKSPKHYVSGRLETIYHIQDSLGPEGFKAYCLGNATKYLSRYRGKNGEEDLKKAYVYLGWAVNGLPEPVNGKVPQ